MKTQQFSKLIELAQSLKWLVWAYDVPDYSKVDPDIAPRKRIYVLRSPNGVPFRDGTPAASEKTEFGTKFSAPARETELEAWQDLPKTEEQLREYSRR